MRITTNITTVYDHEKIGSDRIMGSKNIDLFSLQLKEGEKRSLEVKLDAGSVSVQLRYADMHWG